MITLRLPVNIIIDFYQKISVQYDYAEQLPFIHVVAQYRL